MNISTTTISQPYTYVYENLYKEVCSNFQLIIKSNLRFDVDCQDGSTIIVLRFFLSLSEIFCYWLFFCHISASNWIDMFQMNMRGKDVVPAQEAAAFLKRSNLNVTTLGQVFYFLSQFKNALTRSLKNFKKNLGLLENRGSKISLFGFRF